MLGFSKEHPKTPRIAGKKIFLQYEQCQKLSLPDIVEQLNQKFSFAYEVKDSIVVCTSNFSKVFCYFSVTGSSKRVDKDPSYFNLKKKKLANGCTVGDGPSGFCNRVISELGDIEEELSFWGSEQIFELLNQKRRECRSEILSNKFLSFEKTPEENYDQSTYYSSNNCRSPLLSFTCSGVPSKPSSLSANSQQVYEETIRSLREENQVLKRESQKLQQESFEKDTKYQILENKCSTLESQLEDILVCMKQLQSSHDVIKNKMNFYEKNKK